ncbi:DUF3822 family protein [Aureibacter tunicatorum]|uniref:DUF3822 family protein n=1 Tax=Aureibacter tunicatorum TaxID=866807 RepID=A0AAE4BPU4_9BACT|nr:DUF3822 family protein [Aureibacter tunicatorum]MDR6238359.1 hypothetical protein [Aureibacter tunicatorum]BDD03391.1 hypothetical protein AUTU_08740 [Aureibacter tunicatorum]
MTNLAEDKVFKAVKAIKDNKWLEIDDLHHFVLSLQLGERDFQISVIDPRSNRCLLIEDFIFEAPKNEVELVNFLDHLYDDHSLIIAGFWKEVRVNFKNSIFTFVPEEDFIEEQSDKYLQITTDFNPAKHELFHDQLFDGKIINVFAVPTRLVEYFKNRYPAKEIKVYHQNSVLVEGAFRYTSKDNSNRMFLFIDRFVLHVWTINNGSLQFYNRYQINQFDEYIKYISLISKELDISNMIGDIPLWGFVGNKTPHFRQIQRHIPNIMLGQRPDEVKFGYQFDELEENNYFDIVYTGII